MVDKWDELLANASAEDAAGSRRRRRWLREQLKADRTMGSVFLRLAESRTVASVLMRSGQTIDGTVVGLGADCAVLKLASGANALVATDAVAAVFSDSTPIDSSSNSLDRGVDFMERLTDLLRIEPVLWCVPRSLAFLGRYADATKKLLK